MALAADLANEALRTSVVLDAKLKELRTHIDGMALISLRDRLTTLEIQVVELKRTKEESERRRWQFAYIFVGAVCTLLVTIIVQLVLFWVKK